MILHVCDNLKAEIGERTDGQRNALAGNAGRQFAVIKGAVTVVDTINFQQVETVANILCRAFLAAMGDQPVALTRGFGKDPPELCGGMAKLG